MSDVLALLKRLEWSSLVMRDGGETCAACPDCDQAQREGHAADCEWAALMRAQPAAAPSDADEEDEPKLCSVCGRDGFRFGERHMVCGRAVMEAERRGMLKERALTDKCLAAAPSNAERAALERLTAARARFPNHIDFLADGSDLDSVLALARRVARADAGGEGR